MSESDRPGVRRIITLAPDLKELARGRRFLKQIAEAAGFSAEQVFNVTVAASEACANAIEHAGSCGDIIVECLASEDHLEVRVDGPGRFRLPAADDERQHRGLGLPLMATLSDHLALHSQPAGGTLVTMTFFRGPEDHVHRLHKVLEAPSARLAAAEREREELLVSLKEQLARVTILRETALASAESLSLEEVSGLALKVAQEQLGAKAGAVYLLDEHAGEFRRFAQICHTADEGNEFQSISPDANSTLGRAVALRLPFLTHEAAGIRDFEEQHTGANDDRWIILPLLSKGRAIGGLSLVFEGRRPFQETELSLYQGIASQLALALENARLYESLKKELSRTRLLEQVALAASSGRSLREAGEAILDALSSHFELQSGFLRVLDKTKGTLSLMASIESVGSFERELPLGEKGYLATAAFEKDALLTFLDDQPTSDRIQTLKRVGFDGCRYMACPIRYAGEPVGVFGLAFAGRRPFYQDELDLLSAIADTVGQAIENARLLETERSITYELQRPLLAMPSSVPGIVFSHLYRSATEAAHIGGDFYDLFPLPDGRIAIVIGDVSGHGIGAARMGALIRDTIRAYALDTGWPDLVLLKTNRALLAAHPDFGFATAFLGFLDAVKGRMTYVSAGHPPPLLVQGNECAPVFLNWPSLPLGVFPEATYDVRVTSVLLGDFLVLYTDGVTEARNSNGFFGEAGLREAALDGCMAGITGLPDAIIHALSEHTGSTYQDDIALLCLALENSASTEGTACKAE